MQSRRDFWVGLFVLSALGVITGTLIVTSGLGNVEYDLFVRTESAQDLTRDTRVFLQGLQIGRIRQLNPIRDSQNGRLTFVARLSINERFPDGTPVSLPAGSQALIAQTSPIAAPVVQIVAPRDLRQAVYLQPGDTIDSRRQTNAMDRLGDVAQKLGTEVEAALHQTRTLLAGTNRAVVRTDSLIASSAPLVRRALADLVGSLERTDRILGSLEPRLGPAADSLTATLAQTRQVLKRLEDVATTTNTLATENRESIHETIDRLRRSSIMMDHFIEQVSRRPMRMLTGVKTPQLDAGEPRQ